MPNSMSVYHFLHVDFGEGYLLVVTGGKQSQLLVLGLRLEFDKNEIQIETFETPILSSNYIRKIDCSILQQLLLCEHHCESLYLRLSVLKIFIKMGKI